MSRDIPRLRVRLHSVARRPDTDPVWARLVDDINRSRELRDRRAASVPRIDFPPDLPVSAARAEIADAIRNHQVVVIAGETGSGKTTQLPKICLELGRGQAACIGHTQPRRIAARNVAYRIAEELNTSVGSAGSLVGYKVRFTDLTADTSMIKVMTDGILLAETQTDPLLTQYDTILIDEAHERSLNIDFLIGYLRQLLPKRPDLKVVITSATIDPARFARHFESIPGGCPMLEVSGRTYPVETRYRPILTDEPELDTDGKPLPVVVDPIDAIATAVDEARRDGPGDILVFLATEREIRETAATLFDRLPRDEWDILPLFARLSVEDQQRVFKVGHKRRVVLATNVAETSLTVPNIRYVIDPGEARISRYNPRTKVQRLPVEPISQASAEQRKGRCGRVAPGVCYRLYSEEDFTGRTPYTDPEISRTNLASVILQMLALRLGDIAAFPFLDPPDYRQIRDGYQTLHELGAVTEERHLTDLGRRLARLPTDPRLGRMILAALDEGVLDEVLVIAAGLSVQDPRDRPLDLAQQADAAHAHFRDETSDFLGMLKLWEAYRAKSRELSSSRLRKWCRDHFLSYSRLREWQETHRQLRTLSADSLAERRSQYLRRRDRDDNAKPRPTPPNSAQSTPSPASQPRPGKRVRRRRSRGARGNALLAHGTPVAADATPTPQAPASGAPGNASPNSGRGRRGRRGSRGGTKLNTWSPASEAPASTPPTTHPEPSTSSPAETSSGDSSPSPETPSTT
jgi:ATP-dependent helicase HrpA